MYLWHLVQTSFFMHAIKVFLHAYVVTVSYGIAQGAMELVPKPVLGILCHHKVVLVPREVYNADVFMGRLVAVLPAGVQHVSATVNHWACFQVH
jgi:hypothetical protein